VADTATKHNSELKKKRSWLSTWFLRLILAILLVFAVLVFYAFGSRYLSSRKAQNLLSAISQSELPTTRKEARRYFVSLQTEPDLSNEWLKVFESFEKSEFEADCDELREHGSLFPPPWRNVERLAGITSKHSALIAQVHSAARQSGYVDFINYDEVTFLPGLHKMHRAVFLLACDALVDIDRGDAEGFQESVEGIFKIAQQMDSLPLQVGQLRRISIIGTGLNAVHHSLSRLQLPLDNSKQLAIQLSELDCFDCGKQGLILERAMKAECFQDLQLWEYADRLTAWRKFYVELNAPADLCFYLDQLQNMIDAFEKTPQEAFQIADSTTQIADIERPPPISGSLVPAFRPYMVSLMATTFHADIQCARSKIALPEEKIATVNQSVTVSVGGEISG
jgi:hypothetical protein